MIINLIQPMKSLLTLIFIFYNITFIYSQVGVNTTTPQATLDINGNVMIRNVDPVTNPTDRNLAAQDSILVRSNNEVMRVSSSDVLNATLKTAVKGGFTNATSATLVLSSTYTQIPFDSEEFDLNDEYDPATHTFTAKQDGIYTIKVRINASNSINASINYGVCIRKNGVVVARENFANITVDVVFPELTVGIITIPEIDLLELPVTPPVRKVESLEQLNTGDTITFELFSDLGATVNLSEGIEDCQFTIVQIR